MTRSRTSILALAALLLTAVPALAYSWPTLFGLPSVFGQETSRAEQATSPSRADCSQVRAEMQTRCGQGGAEACEDHLLLADSLATWQRLWSEGQYRQALDLARSAVQAAPQSMAAQHAWAVSQIVNDSRLPAGGVEESEDCRDECPIDYCPRPCAGKSFAQTWQLVLPSLQLPLLPSCCEILGSLNFDVEMEIDADDEAKGCCEKCVKDCKCCCTRNQKQTTAVRRVQQRQPATIVIVRENVLPALPLPPPPIPAPPYFVPPAPAQYLAQPPAVVTPSVEPVTFFAAERGEAVPRTPGVRILQRGGMCFVSSPNYEIRCDRVAGQGGDRLLLEGNVTLVSRRNGQTMTIEAERITLDVVSEQFEIANARGNARSNFTVSPLCPTAGVCPVSGAQPQPSRVLQID